MEGQLYIQVLVLLGAALGGGLLAKFFHFQTLVGYILAGLVVRVVIPALIPGMEQLANIGVILLLFSIGLELSWSKLTKVFKVVVKGAVIQIVTIALMGYVVLSVFHFSTQTSLILAIGYALSSTAVLLKLLSDRGEKDTIHGEIMIGWSLIQDLAAIPIIIILSSWGTAVYSLLKAVLVLGAILILGRILVPKLLHKIALVENRDLFVLTAVFLALGTAVATSLLGISPALGAFLAGVVISESQENHAVFAEVRPLRDLFVALFFVSMGFLVSPEILMAKWGIILLLAGIFIVLKALVIFFVTLVMGYHGKTVLAVSIGLAQIGEFAFILFTIARSLNLISDQDSSIGIATALVTLVAAPFLYKGVMPFWQKLKALIAVYPKFSQVLLGWDKKIYEGDQPVWENQIVICGYGRVGAWVGKALDSANIPFVVIDYNHEVVHKLELSGQKVIYGDPTMREVLQAAGIVRAKVVVIAIPDSLEQEAIIAAVQTLNPDIKIISRVHFDDDVRKLKTLKVDKIVQPEFEASVTIVRSIFYSMGKSKEEIANRLKSLRLSRAMV